MLKHLTPWACVLPSSHDMTAFNIITSYMKPSPLDQEFINSFSSNKKPSPSPKRGNPTNWRKFFRGIGIILGISLIAILALSRLGSWMYQRDQVQYQEYYEAEQFSTKVGLVAMSNEFNNHCPLLMSDYFELNSTSVLEPKTLVFNLEMLGDKSTYSDIAIFKLLVGMDLKDEINQEEYRELRGADVTFLYKFFERDGNFFTEIEMSPVEYK